MPKTIRGGAGKSLLLAVVTWTGAQPDTNSSIHGGNWDSGIVPGPDDDVVIDKDDVIDGAPSLDHGDELALELAIKSLTISADVTLRGSYQYINAPSSNSPALTVTEGANLTLDDISIEGTGWTDIQGKLLTKQQFITMKGDLILAGQLEMNASSVTIDGGLNVLGTAQVNGGTLDISSAGMERSTVTGTDVDLSFLDTKLTLGSKFGENIFGLAGKVTFAQDSDVFLWSYGASRHSRIFFSQRIGSSTDLTVTVDQSQIGTWGELYIGGTGVDNKPTVVDVSIRNKSVWYSANDRVPIGSEFESYRSKGNSGSFVVRDFSSVTVADESAIIGPRDVSISGGYLELQTGAYVASQSVSFSGTGQVAEGSKIQASKSLNIYGPLGGLTNHGYISVGTVEENVPQDGKIDVFHDEALMPGNTSDALYSTGIIRTGTIESHDWLDDPDFRAPNSTAHLPGGARVRLEGLVEADVVNNGTLITKVDQSDVAQISENAPLLKVDGSFHHGVTGVLEYVSSLFFSFQRPVGWIPIEVVKDVIFEGSLHIERSFLVTSEQREAYELKRQEVAEANNKDSDTYRADTFVKLDNYPFIKVLSAAGGISGEISGYTGAVAEDSGTEFAAVPHQTANELSLVPAKATSTLSYGATFSVANDIGLPEDIWRNNDWTLTWMPLMSRDDSEQLFPTMEAIPKDAEGHPYQPDTDILALTDLSEPGYFDLIAEWNSDGIVRRREWARKEVRFPTMDEIVGLKPSALASNPQWFSVMASSFAKHGEDALDRIPERSREVVRTMLTTWTQTLNAAPKAIEYGFGIVWEKPPGSLGRFIVSSHGVAAGDETAWLDVSRQIRDPNTASPDFLVKTKDWLGIDLQVGQGQSALKSVDKPEDGKYLVGWFHTHPSYSGYDFKALAVEVWLNYTADDDAGLIRMANGLREDYINSRHSKPMNLGLIGHPIGPSPADVALSKELTLPGAIVDFRPSMVTDLTAFGKQVYLNPVSTESVAPCHRITNPSMLYQFGTHRRPTTFRGTQALTEFQLSKNDFSLVDSSMVTVHETCYQTIIRRGNVDGDDDFDANDSFLVHLTKLSGSETQIEQSKGASVLSPFQVRSTVADLEPFADVDGDQDFDANDSFLIHLVKLSGTDAQIDQSKGASTLAAAQIRANIESLDGQPETDAASSQNTQALLRISSAEPLPETQSVNARISGDSAEQSSTMQENGPPTEASRGLFAIDLSESPRITDAVFAVPSNDLAAPESKAEFRYWIDAI